MAEDQLMRNSRLHPRAGLSLLEVMVALTILATSLIGMAEYGRRFARTNARASTQNLAMDIATERVEEIKSVRSYVAIDTMVGAVSVTRDGLAFVRNTTIVRTNTAQVDYKTVTVSVNRATMPVPVKKTTAIAFF
jgi:prepilin-type N-terminal cleavage/methylation domain-containing protein